MRADTDTGDGEMEVGETQGVDIREASDANFTQDTHC